MSHVPPPPPGSGEPTPGEPGAPKPPAQPGAPEAPGQPAWGQQPAPQDPQETQQWGQPSQQQPGQEQGQQWGQPTQPGQARPDQTQQWAPPSQPGQNPGQWAQPGQPQEQQWSQQGQQQGSQWAPPGAPQAQQQAYPAQQGQQGYPGQQQQWQPGHQGQQNQQWQQQGPQGPQGPQWGQPAPTKKSSRGLLVGILVAVVVLALAATAFFLLFAGSDPEALEPDVSSSTEASVGQLVVGNCLEDISGSGSVGDVSVVPCADDHTSQVIGSTTFTDGDFPGQPTLVSQTTAACTPDLVTSEDVVATDLTLVVWTPSEASWSGGDRVGLCIATVDGSTTGSLIG